MSKEEKYELLESVLGDDKSDLAEHLRLGCEASLPDAESKEKAWAAITDWSSSDSLYNRAARMGGFYGGWDQQDLVRPYYDKFYELLPIIFEKQSFKMLENFYHNLLPRREFNPDHLIKLVSLKIATADTS